MTITPDLPATCAVAFKEWTSVCRALGGGAQTLLLRKGGIDEPRGTFAPEHPVFWLYPTRLHESRLGVGNLEESEAASEIAEGRIQIDTLAQVADTIWVDALGPLLRLSAHYVWDEETVERKFFYRAPGVWLLLVRIYQTPRPFVIDELPEYAGCRTWVELAEPLPTREARAVLDEDEFARTCREIQAALDASGNRSRPAACPQIDSHDANSQ
jgi:hypothetical protein